MAQKFETQFKKANQSPGFQFWKVANLHQRKQRQALKDLDITPSQFSVLACYFYLQNHQDELPTQALVCEHSKLDKMHVSDITKALLQKKLLSKKSNKEDSRSYRLELTANGATICNKAVRLIEKLDHQFFGHAGDIVSFQKMLTLIEAQEL